jgi:pyruvate/2-oxoglutarate/acetoin dehydrogenase E1 component
MPYDAKGLLKTALRGAGVTLFFEHNKLMSVKGIVPEADYTVPFGVADIKKIGNDVTIVATSYMVWKALSVANKLESEGIKVEVIDPRTFVPLDRNSIVNSVKKTGRLITVEEGCLRGGFGAEIIAVVVEDALEFLKVPVIRIGNPNAMIPYKVENEAYILPQEADIERAVRKTLGK